MRFPSIDRVRAEVRELSSPPRPPRRIDSLSTAVRRLLLSRAMLARSAAFALFLGLAACSSVYSTSPDPSKPTDNSTGNAPAGKNDGVAGVVVDPGPPSTQTQTTDTKLRFGVAPQSTQTYAPPNNGPANVDSVVIGDWLIENGFTDAHKAKLQSIIAAKKTPYFFGYILTAMTKQGLGDTSDCDGDSTKKLCQEGADYIRSHIENDILPKYRDAAQKIGAVAGNNEVLIHLEPDYFQFSEKAQQHPFTHDESNGFMNKILLAISEGCPSCRAVADFSTWFSPDKTAWATTAKAFYEGWDRTILSYVGLTGKQFPFTDGKIDNFTYAEIVSEMALPLVVIDGYTFGGGAIDVDKSWLDATAVDKARQMGIAWVFLSQQGDVAGFDAFLAMRQ
jgi:hypothetical protein